MQVSLLKYIYMVFALFMPNSTSKSRSHYPSFVPSMNALSSDFVNDKAIMFFYCSKRLGFLLM
jgi:hypothetical protein